MNLRAKPKLVQGIEVATFYDEFKDPLQLTLVAGKEGLQTVIREKSINRPGIAMTGFLTCFGAERLQLFGGGEMAYLETLSRTDQKNMLVQFAKLKIPCMAVSRNLEPTPIMVDTANRYGIPLFRSPITSNQFVTTATVLLEHAFAPQVTEHGTMLDIRGIGTLLRGKSGIGKSECAVALIERGHSLVADDLIYVKLINDTELIGQSSELNRGYMECRGIGIINVAELFGIRNVRLEKRIDLVVSFREWSAEHEEERTGLEQSFFNILGIDVPHVEFYIRPGRDLARLVEVAAMVMAARIMGHDSAREFNQRLIAHMAQQAGS
ncbi:MAG: HPr(Ser) kinase/phosphatase [Opitutae bacterium]|nr:HPr(Ser) kinase/phosphatase [Opitutae bacterium]MBC9888538.1 HPr(Ser) kinase/phosphatase [Opitutae bacterium]